MAKNSLFWGKASGKLGEVVMYRAGGEQRSRMYVQNVKNPKTLAQMEQRMKLASLVGFFKSLKPVLRFSFPQRPVNQSGFNAFVAASLPNATTALPNEAAATGLSVPLGYTISRGDIVLPAGALVAPVWTESAENKLVGGIQLLPVGNASENTISNTELANRFSMAEAMQLALTKNPALDAQLPQKFNLVVVSSSYVDDGFAQSFHIYKFERSNDALTVEMPTDPTFPSGVWSAMIGTAATGGAIILGGVTSDEDNGASLVGSFFSFTDAEGKLHVSDAQMVVSHDDGGYFEQFQKGGDAYVSYLEGLGYNVGDILGTR